MYISYQNERIVFSCFSLIVDSHVGPVHKGPFPSNSNKIRVRKSTVSLPCLYMWERQHCLWFIEQFGGLGYTGEKSVKNCGNPWLKVLWKKAFVYCCLDLQKIRTVWQMCWQFSDSLDLRLIHIFQSDWTSTLQSVNGPPLGGDHLWICCSNLETP